MKVNVGDFVESKYSNWIGIITQIQLNNKNIQIVKVKPIIEVSGNIINDRPEMYILNSWIRKIKSFNKLYNNEYKFLLQP